MSESTGGHALHRCIAEALAENFTPANRDGQLASERVDQGMMTFFTASDGHLSMAPVTPNEAADVVLAVLPAPVDRCSCLDKPALTAEIGYPVRCPHCPPGTDAIPPTHWTKHVQRHHPEAPPADWAVVEAERDAYGEQLAEAAEAQPATVDLRTLAAALDGLHTLIATSSRDWQTYRVDAWLWALLCGWDCEQDEHDDTCTHGALEETAAMHGWDADTVAKARRYRTAVRALTDTATEAPTATEAQGLSELEAAARTLELDRDATEDSADYRRGMTRAVELLRLLDRPDTAAGARQDGAPDVE